MRGEDAARIGLVLQAVPPDELDAEVDRMARRIALMDPELAAAEKRIVNAGLELMGWGRSSAPGGGERRARPPVSGHGRIHGCGEDRWLQGGSSPAR